jgi:hypothetical protein
MVIQNRVYVKRDLPGVRIVRLHNRFSGLGRPKRYDQRLKEILRGRDSIVSETWRAGLLRYDMIMV